MGRGIKHLPKNEYIFQLFKKHGLQGQKILTFLEER